MTRYMPPETLAPPAHGGEALGFERMRAALEAVGIGVWEYDPATGQTLRSGAYDAIHGYPAGYPGAWSAETCFAHIVEEDRPRVAADWERAIGRQLPMHCTYRIRRADSGAVRWVEAQGAPRAETGTALRFVGTLADVTEKLERERQRETLVGEMRHRVRNILANVQALARDTGRNAQSVDQFLAAFGGRLSALAQAHDLAVRDREGGASLTAVVRAALEPWAKTGQIQVPTGAWQVTARQAVALSLALHELATNATKYGALSIPSGRVDLTMRRDPEGGVQLTWQESGGPQSPPRQGGGGFGGRLLRQALPVELAGSIALDFPPEGARCVLRFPTLPAAAEPAGAALPASAGEPAPREATGAA